jgi:hydrogenase/urease accessory protein HupE
MRSALAAAAVVLLWAVTPAFAHRLDEYLQATTFSVARDHVEVRMRLTPGVAVLPQLLPLIDTNGDGVICQAEQQAYADRVRGEVSLAIDATPLPLRLASITFPKLEDMKAGLGDIVLNFEAEVPKGGANRRLVFENHHQPAISVYLANCLVARDPTIQVVSQNRNYTQSFYQLDYTQAGVDSNPPTNSSSSAAGAWVNQTGSRSLFKAFFYHGVHHILTGYDHLLFVSALVLAAISLWDVVKVVSAFTVAHTITLTLAALNLVHVSERVVEPLISASIVFVAMQNVFWPSGARGWSRLGAAFFFGLFHGLGFAGGLLEAMREMQSGTMFLAILAFSIGVETGHQMVVLPLFGFLKLARRSQPDAVLRTRLSMAFQRVGSAGISIAGIYYLCIALMPPS